MPRASKERGASGHWKGLQLGLSITALSIFLTSRLVDEKLEFGGLGSFVEKIMLSTAMVWVHGNRERQGIANTPLCAMALGRAHQAPLTVRWRELSQAPRVQESVVVCALVLKSRKWFRSINAARDGLGSIQGGGVTRRHGDQFCSEKLAPALRPLELQAVQ